MLWAYPCLLLEQPALTINISQNKQANKIHTKKENPISGAETQSHAEPVSAVPILATWGWLKSAQAQCFKMLNFIATRRPHMMFVLLVPFYSVVRTVQERFTLQCWWLKQFTSTLLNTTNSYACLYIAVIMFMDEEVEGQNVEIIG